jgi:uncharacterized protein involved in outer membrane biogenesis
MYFLPHAVAAPESTHIFRGNRHEKRLMNNALLYLGGILVAVFAALFAVPYFVDWNGYRGVFEEEASKVLGRDVRVGGAVNLRFLPAPYVYFEKVRLADISGQTGEPLLRVERFRMWLSSPALLRGVLEATEIELDKPEVTLAVDSKGSGNWSSIELRPGDLPFVPRDVALRSVKLTDGTLTVYNSDVKRIANVEAINGEFSADGLKGPFRFKGAAKLSGTNHDIKFATTEQQSDGSFRIKAAVHVVKSPTSYVVDGHVATTDGAPKFSGTLTAKLAVPGVEPESKSAETQVPVLDLKAGIKADAFTAELDDITLSLESAAGPQTITGKATAAWADVPRLDVELTSKWLDFDRLAGAGQETASFSKIRKLGMGIMQAAAGDGSAGAKINLEQIKIGGETVGGLRIDAERRDGVLHVKEFKAGLPGGSRVDLMGDVQGEASNLSFKGKGFVRGTSLARLKTWAGKSGTKLDIQADGPFSAEGSLLLTDTRFELTDASGDISGRPLSGEVKMISGDRTRIEVILESARFDSREFFPETVRAIENGFRRTLGLETTAGEEASSAVPTDMSLRLLTGEMTGTSETWRNVDVTVRFENGGIYVPAAKLVTQAGLQVSLDGRIKSENNLSKGTLAYDLVGSTPDAVKDAIRLLGIDNAVARDEIASVKSARISGLMRLGARGDASADVTVDGMVNDAHVVGFVELDQGLGKWRTSPGRLHMTADTPTLASLSGLIGNVQTANEPSAQPARASVTVSGVIGTGAASRIEIKTDGFAFNYSGRTHWPDNGRIETKGIAIVDAHEVADVLALFGIRSASGIAGTKAKGVLAVARTGDGWSLESDDLTFGVSQLKGKTTIAASEANATKISADISSDRVTVSGLLSAIVALPKPSNEQTDVYEADGATGDRSIWPTGVFNFAPLSGIEGAIDLKFQSLGLSGNIASGPGSMRIALSPDKIAVTDLKAEAANGALSAGINLEKAIDGVALSGEVKLANADFAAFSPAAKGRGSIAISANARAQSPAGLIAVMKGEGTAHLEDVVLLAPNPATASHIADDVVNAKVPNDAEKVAAAFLNALRTAKLDLGTRDMAVVLADGTAKIAPIAVETSAGKLSATTTVDGLSFGINSAWVLSGVLKPLPPPAVALPGWKPPRDAGPLPPALVVYSGRLDDLAAVAQHVDVAEFQRELAVRQMERNVEELERLRRMDQERARLEKERRKALERDRAAAAPRQQNMQQPAPAGVNAVESGQTQSSAPKITIEPLPPPNGAAADAVSEKPVDATVDPEAIVEPAEQKAARPRPSGQRAQRKPRTASEEVLRALGVYP